MKTLIKSFHWQKPNTHPPSPEHPGFLKIPDTRLSSLLEAFAKEPEGA